MYALTLLLFEYTQDFSREYKYTIGQDIKRDALQLIRSIYRVNKASAKREYFLLRRATSTSIPLNKPIFPQDSAIYEY